MNDGGGIGPSYNSREPRSPSHCVANVVGPGSRSRSARSAGTREARGQRRSRRCPASVARMERVARNPGTPERIGRSPHFAWCSFIAHPHESCGRRKRCGSFPRPQLSMSPRALTPTPRSSRGWLSPASGRGSPRRSWLPHESGAWATDYNLVSRPRERPTLGGASEEPGPICGRPPTCKSEAACGSDRLRSYVRSVDGGAHDRLPRWVPRREFQTESRCQAPLGPTECLASGIDRSHHLLCLLASSGLSARRRLPSRRTRYALVIITASGSRGVVHDRSEGRGAEPPRSAAPRPSRATADVVATWRAGS